MNSPSAESIPIAPFNSPPVFTDRFESTSIFSCFFCCVSRSRETAARCRAREAERERWCGEVDCRGE